MDKDGIMARDMRDMSIEALALSKVAKLEGPIKKEKKIEDSPLELLESIKRTITTPVIERREDIEGLLNQRYLEEKSEEAIKLALNNNNYQK